MAEERTVTPQQLRQLLIYNPDDGTFRWRRRREVNKMAAAWNRQFAGSRAFVRKAPKGYMQGHISHIGILAHRAAWAYVHGEWPAGQIDHINGDRSDNRLSNLRVVSASENAKNRERKKGREGKVGVTWYPRSKSWRVQIGHEGQAISLGYYKDFEKAVAVRLDAEKAFGFHKNAGRYDVMTPAK